MAFSFVTLFLFLGTLFELVAFCMLRLIGLFGIPDLLPIELTMLAWCILSAAAVYIAARLSLAYALRTGGTPIKRKRIFFAVVFAAVIAANLGIFRLFQAHSIELFGAANVFEVMCSDNLDAVDVQSRYGPMTGFRMVNALFDLCASATYIVQGICLAAVFPLTVLNYNKRLRKNGDNQKNKRNEDPSVGIA
ncbi:MAG: hypothetical protein LBR54_01325 [Oscillospiraceae bacterium]|jgi:hypothetical protein|nr:hypothetical protein [Oscillospiraceae bacterium]